MDSTVMGLPEWSDEQQAIDFKALVSSSRATNETRLIAADICARVVPMGVQGADKGVRERVDLLAYHSGKSVDQIEVLRRVGARWLPEHREAVVECTIDWSAIRAACVKTPSPGNDLDPCAVLVKTALKITVVSARAFAEAYEAAVEGSIPKQDVIEASTTALEDLVRDKDAGGGERGSPSPLDDLILAINSQSGSKAEKTSAAGVAAELLLWMQSGRSVAEKFSEVRELPASKPVRDIMIKFVKDMMAMCDIDPSEIS